MRLPTFYEQNLIPNWGNYSLDSTPSNNATKKQDVLPANLTSARLKFA